MSVVIRFVTEGFSAEKYDEVVKRLEKAGAGSPAGRQYHVCFGDKNNLRVSDIWESREAFEKFGETLKPILEEVGIAPGETEILEVYKTIEGTRSATAKP
jgi:hypothetical protein